MTKSRATQFRNILITGLLFPAGVALWLSTSQAQEAPHLVPAPEVDESAQAGGPEVAVLAGGCFWGVQGVFQHVKGVTSAVSGYAGGDRQHAQYEIVSTGTTGVASKRRVSSARIASSSIVFTTNRSVSTVPLFSSK